MARVALKNLTKVFDGKITAVNNITLDVADHEFMVIVGPSGCGKTTILRMIAGLERITSGTVTIGGNIVNDVPPKDRDIAMVFQNYALYPHMTVFQNMAFGLKLRKHPKAEIKKRVMEAAKLLGIEDLLDRRPGTLSGGQRQRVAVGRAIVHSPKVFLFDEPLSNLDAEIRLNMRAELKSIQRKLKTTLIYVTHDQIEAMTLGDRICVLHNGAIQQVAAPLDVYNQPANRFVAGFLGTMPMNFLDGVIRYKDDTIYFTTNSETIRISDQMKDALKAYRDKQVVLGIRPEHLSFNQLTGQSENNINCEVMEIDPVGNHANVFLKNTLGNKMIANVSSHTNIRIGRSIVLHFDLEKIHIFESGGMGKNISLRI